MALLDRQLLQDIGIQLSEQDFESLSAHFETTLRERVIAEIVQELSPEQAQELAAMQGAGDEQLLAWLQANVPEFGDIVSDEIDILLGELAENSDAFNGGAADQGPPASDHF